MSETPTMRFTDTVDDAVRRMVTAEHFHAASIVSMPLLYPSGASVILELSLQAGRVFISDRGGGYQEAEFAGASRVYCREADRIATDAGIKFDGREMFIAEAPLDRIEGAMVVVASSSAQAAAFAALKAADRVESATKDVLYDRLGEVFGPAGFEKDVSLLGSSNHAWRVDARVKRGDAVAVFNTVTSQYTSATGTAAKFYDLGRLEIAPVRVAVVVSRNAIGDWYGVISAASDAVLEITAANDQFSRFGRAG